MVWSRCCGFVPTLVRNPNRATGVSTLLSFRLHCLVLRGRPSPPRLALPSAPYRRLPTAFFERRRASAAIAVHRLDSRRSDRRRKSGAAASRLTVRLRGIVLRITEGLFTLIHLVVHRPGDALQRRCPLDADLASPRLAQQSFLPASANVNGMSHASLARLPGPCTRSHCVLVSLFLL